MANKARVILSHLSKSYFSKSTAIQDENCEESITVDDKSQKDFYNDGVLKERNSNDLKAASLGSRG